ncbi:oxidoreductase [Prosthecomicrobium pneumaticum]|uniref:NAD(P)-dependent dehydrogenase (Short-subunit alcohol dehydrogenase family) n=1 Tax=Prosthecomicrobium pneumaticum TaxID=81895 RepID=A0A7W9L3T5_9HYPH|nr:oxidoreductase [Prosthecomicrobium pneumaticum]MBB5754884.1 NAD(P)-dependent dehydrogenase (short-subunit alcohol dehydrogenase family) [Prosthecomicrobium pneumaticum]
MTKTWFVTGASRGLGAAIATAALDAGDRVVATGRDPAAITAALGAGEDRLLALRLDVAAAGEAEAAAAAALERFGRIDVLVNNAGYGHLGLFEETAPEDAERQFATNVFGLFAVTRAVLPAMRRQRSGHVFNLSSIAGVRGGPGGSLYCASKFAVAGFSESLANEVAGLGIKVTIVEPGFFRTDFLDPRSVAISTGGIEDYRTLSEQIHTLYRERNHQQAGDPAKLAAALVRLAGEAEPPLHFAVGSDAVEVVSTKLANWTREFEAWRALSASTDGAF